jgi:hypothetical protein
MRAPNESKTGSNGMATGYKGQEYLVRKLFGCGRPNAPPINSPFSRKADVSPSRRLYRPHRIASSVNVTLIAPSVLTILIDFGFYEPCQVSQECRQPSTPHDVRNVGSHNSSAVGYEYLRILSVWGGR